MTSESVLHVAIVDDEPLARARLRRLLAKVGGGAVKVVFEAADVGDLLKAAADTPVDIVFLDIEMPGGDGFSALKRWPGEAPQIVFVTAYEEYGARAFDSRALDYLLKPTSAERLADTLNRANEAMKGRRDSEGGKRPRSISVSIGSRREIVPVDSIDLVLARRNYLELHAGRRQFVVRRPLHEFHASLNSPDFIRLHRSALVRRSAIRSLKALGSGRYQVELANGQRVGTGRNYRAVVRSLMDERSGRDAS